MEDRHFWHAARNGWILRALEMQGVRPPARVLEVGCGSGAVASALHDAGFQVTGIDPAEVLIRKAHQRCPAATFIAGNLSDLPADHGPFDAICLFDVLEHVTDPRSLLQMAAARARPGALVIATVPALRSLHTVIDDLSGHKKRYEPGELAELMRQAGLRDVAEYGIFRWITSLLRFFRRRAVAEDAAQLGPERRKQIMAANMRLPPRPIDLALRILCTLERLTFSRARDRPGATALAVARVV